MNKVAIFIDGGYIAKVLKNEFDHARIDYGKLVDKLIEQSGQMSLLRSYYYDCPPWQDKNPTVEQKRRYAAKQKFFTALDSIPRFQVRKGDLAHRGLDKKGDPIFLQKRVDIMFGVDLVTLALKGKISHAIILAGDSDFIPAIKVAKQEGVLIHLFHGGDYHRELWQEADERTQIDSELINHIKMD